MSAEAQRESLLNAPALMFMSGVLLIAFWVLFPRQPAFRDPANLSAKDALSVAYLRVLVQSDPENAPLRLSFVQLLTEAGMIDEAATAIAPLQHAPESNLTYEVRLADLRLTLQQLYRRPAPDIEASLRTRISQLVPSLLHIARNDRELNQVVASAEQFGEPSLLAETFEQLIVLKNETHEKKLRWLVFAAKQRIAADQPRLAARNFMKAFKIQENPQGKLELAKSALRAYLQAGLNQEAQKEEALNVAIRVHERVGADTELLLLGANIAEPLADHVHALAWLEQAGERLPAIRCLRNVSCASRYRWACLPIPFQEPPNCASTWHPAVIATACSLKSMIGTVIRTRPSKCVVFCTREGRPRGGGSRFRIGPGKTGQQCSRSVA